MAAGTRTHRFQAPKGTRDFYPADMALRRHIERIWREVSISHGFEEVDGPTYEHLDLYTLKSGPGIVSELFSFRRSGGDTDYALRPEFTPTLARMVAARAAQLPRPVRWFCMPWMFRAERPQRGRLRAHEQWNADVIGSPGADGDADVLAVAVGILERLGLRPTDVQVRLSHRDTVATLLRRLGLADADLPAAFDLLDRRDKMPPEAFAQRVGELGLPASTAARFDELARVGGPLSAPLEDLARRIDMPADDLEQLGALSQQLRALGLEEWCTVDLGIVRGLAYYTGTVFEIHETSGRERAIAGGGRYDNLIELFGGPPTPAVGIAMGDVVIQLVLEERGLLEPAEAYLPRPDAYVLSARDEEPHVNLLQLVAALRRSGLHVRSSAKATRNVGKLLGEAAKARARWAVILGRELDEGLVTLKDLDGGEQRQVPMTALEAELRRGTEGTKKERTSDA